MTKSVFFFSKKENVNRHIWFDSEPITYRSYGWNRKCFTGQAFGEIVQMHDLRVMTKYERCNEGFLGIRVFFFGPECPEIH